MHGSFLRLQNIHSRPGDVGLVHSQPQVKNTESEKPVPFGFLFGHPCYKNMCD